MTIINPASFQGTGEVQQHSFGTTQNGTIEVTLGRETRRVSARKVETNYGDCEVQMIAYDMTGRYRTGGKAWPAHVTHYINGRWAGSERVWFGRDDRSGRFNKANALFFAPQA